ncbi:serine protease [Rhodococcus sp. BP-349]|uniref:S1 family peptidase n=1 Tax=unclassified Rhodococcus (in: high G+C Gram-positive bacteria) TaxID=192944 RepID=UPI001C9B0592|nr:MULTISPECIES: S1 family peptidase [unclassified Rhodococcus (in: high G+C Gram-positive bacteria)]MBY6539358.1 serine protease [Rhodococcus sp. BP-363]MBY6544314.1 serine protease [Rhodococcus sp. BP-369]MBY6563544.1 serine protease [Rhodococcus sp. BP-370]MBY6577836.1 serine protease [Rhodococcus sp. BP-364]MBY6587137.1 serine protease [Rhodococcus sp. BP-358]
MLKKIVLVATTALALAGGIGAGTASAAPVAVLGGGSGVLVADSTGKGKFDCTLTTIGNDAAGRLVGITAGHCGVPGDLIGAEYLPDAGAVGRIVSSVPGLDYAVIEFDRGRVAPTNRVGNVTITGVGAPSTFPGIMCKEGRTTGNTCGITYGELFQNDRTYTQICVQQGDSGGPVVAGTTLVGMVNAYLGIPCIGPEVGTNIQTVLDDINRGGGVGTGFTVTA